MSVNDQAAIAEMVRLPPIVDIRALNYTWAEIDPKGGMQAIICKAYRIEVRRAGETEWRTIPVIEINGQPDQPIGDS